MGAGGKVMRIAMSLFTVLALISTTGCKKKPKDQPVTTTPDAAAMAGSDMGSAGSGSDTAMGSGSDSGSGSAGSGEQTMTKMAGNCPSTVFGATTKAEVKGKDVVLTITAADKDAIGAIQSRTVALLKEKADGGKGMTHDQKGSVGGGKGICPVHFGDGGKGTSKKDAKGVVITITTADAAALKTTIDERITKTTDWMKTNVKEGDKGTSGGVGGGKGGHGQNHSGSGDSKGKDRKGDGKGGGAGIGGGGGKGTGGGSADNKDGSGS
jgi:hypothetical protein